MSNAANVAILDGFRTGIVSSAGLSVPCPWSRSAAAEHRGEDVGVSLTCLAEYPLYRWGPITHAPSLLDGDGGFPRTAADLGEHADSDELRRECRAQVERAVWWGFDPTHLRSHRDALSQRPELFDVMLDLAIEYQLPLSLPDADVDLGFPARSLAADEGVLVVDHVIEAPLGRSAGATLDAALAELKAGVTELRVRPAVDCAELRAITGNWATHVADHHLVTADWSMRAGLRRSGAEVIGYRELRAAQRRG